MYPLLGLIGSSLIVYSNLPQILLFIRQSHAKGISKSSTWCWLIGTICRGAYLVHLSGWDVILLAPYVLAVVFSVVTLYYCYKIDT